MLYMFHGNHHIPAIHLRRLGYRFEFLLDKQLCRPLSLDHISCFINISHIILLSLHKLHKKDHICYMCNLLALLFISDTNLYIKSRRIVQM